MRDTVARLGARHLIQEGNRNTGSAFTELWSELLKRDYELGAELEPNSQTISFFYQLYRAYVDHKNLPGVVLLGPDLEGVVMWGASNETLSMRWGKTAVAWGTYVRPQYESEGWEQLLNDMAMAKLRGLGFEAVMADMPIGEEPPAGAAWAPATTTYVTKVQEDRED